MLNQQPCFVVLKKTGEGILHRHRTCNGTFTYQHEFLIWFRCYKKDKKENIPVIHVCVAFPCLGLFADIVQLVIPSHPLLCWSIKNNRKITIILKIRFIGKFRIIFFSWKSKWRFCLILSLYFVIELNGWLKVDWGRDVQHYLYALCCVVCF